MSAYLPSGVNWREGTDIDMSRWNVKLVNTHMRVDDVIFEEGTVDTFDIDDLFYIDFIINRTLIYINSRRQQNSCRDIVSTNNCRDIIALNNIRAITPYVSQENFVRSILNQISRS